MGDLRPRQRGGARRGAVRRARGAADAAGAQRAGDGACRGGLRQGDAPAPHDGLHDLDRPRRDESRHRRRRGARQPPAAAAAAWRCVRHTHPRPRAAAARGLRRRPDQCERLSAAPVTLLRPHHPARAAHRRLSSGHAGAHRSRRVRPGDSGAVPGRAGGGALLAAEPVRRAPVGTAPAAPCHGRARSGTRRAAPGAAAARHLRRRCAVLRGGGDARAVLPASRGTER